MNNKITHKIIEMCRRVSIWHVGVLVALLVLSVFAVNAQQDKNVVAIVININGGLDYRATSGDNWIPAKKNQALYNGYQLRTQLGNKAMIVYSSGTRVLINENTELEIIADRSGDQKKPTKERTKLITGEIYNKVKPKNNYEVETPSSVASVRGTGFNANYGNGQASFLVVESVVEVMNQLGSVLLEKYQMTTVPDGQAPQPPQQLNKNDVNKITKWTDDVEPIWKLNLMPEGGNIQKAGTNFTIMVTAAGKSGSVDTNASLKLTKFASEPDNLEFSTDGGKTWTKTPNVSIVNGQAAVTARGSADGVYNINSEASQCEPGSASVTIGKPKQRSIIDLLFANPDGSGEKTIELELEEK